MIVKYDLPFKIGSGVAVEIIDLLEKHDGLRAAQIAKHLGLDRGQVNSALYGSLSGRVMHDEDYAWHLASHVTASVKKRSETRPVPLPEPLDEFCPDLVRMVAATSWLPHPDVVAEVGRAVFPTVRMRKGNPRLQEIIEDGVAVGMYDDNATPEWAIFWAHGLRGARPQGWIIAHIWPVSDDIEAYTHLANLVMVPESLASLTDKQGPLSAYLRWHSWAVYGWKPNGIEAPIKPDGYVDARWRYLDQAGDPWELVKDRMYELNNQRVRILRPIMEQRGWL